MSYKRPRKPEVIIRQLQRTALLTGSPFLILEFSLLLAELRKRIKKDAQ